MMPPRGEFISRILNQALQMLLNEGTGDACQTNCGYDEHL
jgi:hypothetical protein